MEHATKTDLSLLLECLKCQMKCPDSQKQALLTIYSICHQSGENVEYFHDLGGVMFVHGLSQSSPHPPVKQTALFILGALTESNYHCKQALCKRETFRNLLESLQADVPITQKRVAVYMLSALVSNNRSGQEFAHTSDCIQVLLDLFRWSFPLSSKAEAVGESKMTQLWTAVSSALCACVNNPQNDLNQRVCMSAFPLVCSWLQQMSPPRPEVLQPLCSFIAMTLHNNRCAQEYFSSVGGLGTLCVSLADLVPLSAQSPPACRMAIMLTKTLAACVTENSGLAAGLSAQQLVPVLVLLLSCPTLDQRDQLSVVLTMGLCTDSSEEHQLQLLANGGLPLVISLLTETQDEELKKAATFVLQTCKKITGMLAPDLRSGHEEEHQSELESHWKSAREILQRINNLEKQQPQAEEEQWERDVGNSTDQQEGTFGILYAPPPQTPSLQCSDPTEEFWEGTPLRSVRGHQEGRLRHRNKTYKEQPVQRAIFKSVSERNQPLQSHHATFQDGQREREREMEERAVERERGETGSSRWRDHTLTETREKRERGGERRRDVEREAWRDGERERWRGVEREKWKDGERRRDGEREIEKDWAERESKGERGRDGGRSRIPIKREGHMTEREGRERSRIPAHLNSASLTDTYSCQPAEGGEHTDRMPGPLLSVAPQLKPPVPSEDEMSICSEVLEQEIQRVLLTPASFTHSALRCLGCVSGVCDVSSRSFAALLYSSQQKCETHLLLLRADQRYRQQLKRTHTLTRNSDTHTLTHARGTHTLTLTQCSDTHAFTHSRHTHTLRACPPGHTHGSPECGFCTVDTHCKSDTHCEGDAQPHTPLLPREAEAGHTLSQLLGDTDRRDGRTHNLTHRDELTAVNLTPLKRPPHVPVRGRYREEQMSEDETNTETSEGHCRRRNRKDFSGEELAFLLEGVRRFGPSWNSILWSYPFQSGRTNVDLAQKYRRMKKTETTL